MKKRIAILGSTGSIGQQALEVVRELHRVFEVEVLTANNNADLLIRQAQEFKPNVVVIGNEDNYLKVKEALFVENIKVYAGNKSVLQVLEMDTIDLVLNAIVGFDGLKPALSAIENRKPLALANKESLVIAGDLVKQAALTYRTPIIPVDSEHSAIFQCLAGEMNNPVEKIILTASGGPFRNFTNSKLEKIRLVDALIHPNWKMGDKVTIDSASLMNKGLEAIGAHWLFDLAPSQIEVLIHPESVIHSLVCFADGSVKAQMSLPDMRLPVQYALTYPERVKNNFPKLDLTQTHSLNFEKPDLKKFRNLALAFEALKSGGNMPCILNAANETAVQAFTQEKINFLKIPEIVEECMQQIPFVSAPIMNDYVETDRLTRLKATELIKKTF